MGQSMVLRSSGEAFRTPMWSPSRQTFPGRGKRRRVEKGEREKIERGERGSEKKVETGEWRSNRIQSGEDKNRGHEFPLYCPFLSYSSAYFSCTYLAIGAACQ